MAVEKVDYVRALVAGPIRRPNPSAVSLYLIGPVASVRWPIAGGTTVAGRIPTAGIQATAPNLADSAHLRGRTSPDQGSQFTDGRQSPTSSVQIQPQAVLFGIVPDHSVFGRWILPFKAGREIDPSGGWCPRHTDTGLTRTATALTAASAAAITTAFLANAVREYA